jgi:enoyl-CoA hydratase
MNAMDSSHKRALAEIWRTAENDPAVRAMVLRGAGPKAFSAGSDFKEMKETGHTVTTEVLADAIPTIGVPLTKPVIASLHGYVIGFGLTLAIHCDLRIAHSQARLAFPEVEHGMLSGISDITLPGIVGEAAALEIMLTGRTYTGQEARDINLVNRISDEPFEEALKLATMMASHSMMANRLTKRLVLAGRRSALLNHMAAVAEARIEIGNSKRHATVVSETTRAPRVQTD